jgi:hypothetical protein
MTVCQYCTPEWLEESALNYGRKPEFKEQLKKLSIKLCYLVRAEPAWGIDDDIIFGMFFEQGDLARLEFFDKDQAFGQADYVLGATPQEWKRLLRKKGKFVTDFMLGKVSLEHGSKVGVLSVAPHANTIVDALTQVELQFPDEMSAQELDTYRTKVKAFREELAV